MKHAAPKRQRCAIYTRKSTEHNLDLAFNSLDAQRETCEAYIKSQAHEGWVLVRDRFDDGGLSGASLDRPALQSLLDRVRARQIDIIVVYKVDRLTCSLADFAKLVELFDEHEASFVSVTQSFNTTSSMGRLTLNVLLSFAQFEREVIGERVASKRSRATRCLAVAEANPRAIAGEINRLRSLDLNELRGEWRRLYCKEPPRISRDIFVLALAHKEPLFRHRAIAIRLRWRGPSIAVCRCCKTLLPTERKGSARACWRMTARSLFRLQRSNSFPATTK
jgi:Resolvase, N terminal domain